MHFYRVESNCLHLPWIGRDAGFGFAYHRFKRRMHRVLDVLHRALPTSHRIHSVPHRIDLVDHRPHRVLRGVDDGAEQKESSAIGVGGTDGSATADLAEYVLGHSSWSNLFQQALWAVKGPCQGAHPGCQRVRLYQSCARRPGCRSPQYPPGASRTRTGAAAPRPPRSAPPRSPSGRG